MNNFGTEWGIWDLHVHTPASIEQQYGGDTEGSWERFFQDIENLDENFKVIGISDYWLLDGYEKVIEAHKNGRMKNIKLFLPVIEMRLNHFGGSNSSLSRINLHVIFDNSLSAQTIREQFISKLSPSYQLNADDDRIIWNAVITRDSMIDLGKKIKSTLPENKLKQYGSDLQEGFNNLNTSLEKVNEALDNSMLKGKYLTAIGKSEWSSIKWNEQSIAEKKNLINNSNFIFSAYKDTSNWAKEVQSFKNQKINYKIIDCSDAHYNSDSSEDMRIGNCATWMNTTLTFSGLIYALSEFERRVYVGIRPNQLQKIDENPQEFIERIKIWSKTSKDTLFAHDIVLNPGFVAVVGNKGQGKSALLDCIALSGNSNRNDDFAFLNNKRFLSARSRPNASKYQAQIYWKNGMERAISLTEGFDPGHPVSLEYLPQMFVERICNSHGEEAESFENEIKNILFTHIQIQDRENKNNFNELLDSKTEVYREKISGVQNKLLSACKNYFKLLDFKWNHQKHNLTQKLHPKIEEMKKINENISKLEAEIEESDTQNKNSRNAESTQILRNELLSNQNELELLKNEKTALIEKITSNNEKITEIPSIKEKLEKVQLEVTSINQEFSNLNNSGGDVLELTVNLPLLNNLQECLENSNTELNRSVYSKKIAISEKEEEIKKKTKVLREIDGHLQALRERIASEEKRRSNLQGDKTQEDTIDWLEHQIKRLDNLPAEIEYAEAKLLEYSEEIYKIFTEQKNSVRSLYQPAAEYIENSTIINNIGLEFSTEIYAEDIWSRIAELVNKNKSSKFEDWAVSVHPSMDIDDWSDIKSHLENLIIRINTSRGDSTGEPRDPRNIFNGNFNLIDFIYSVFSLNWLKLRFGITGGGQSLSHLSPGQRGLILTLFYLVVDLRTTPLLLDQPEENLDNETIASNLVPALHFASSRRQIIVVTHNANLAIVGDADQIIHCSLEQGDFKAKAGSIADFEIATTSVQILEGTKYAFNNRKTKYDTFQV